MTANATADSPDCSLVIAAYNEAENLPALLERIAEVRGSEPWEVIVVDDGSEDATAELLRERAGRWSWFRGVRLRRNFGKSAALAAGIERARASVIVTMDADLQDDPSQIPELLDPLRRGEADLALGWRSPRRDAWSKIAVSRVLNGMVSLLSGTRFRDINSGFRAVRREVIWRLQSPPI